MKHSLFLSVKTRTKIIYQVLMILGIILIVVGLGLAFAAMPLIFLSFLGVLIFLVTYFPVKEVNAEEIKLIVEANGDKLIVHRENNKGYQTRKTVLKASELSSLQLVILNGAFGIKYYCIEARTKAKGPMNNKIIRLLSPLLAANDNEIQGILQFIQKQYPSIKLGH